MTGWIVPGAPTDSTGLSPQQQKQFSSWWLDQQYGGDLSNVAGLTQNYNGYWQGEPGRKYDINPETGQRGVYQFLSGSGAPGWLDVTPKKYGTYSYEEWNEDAGEWETVTKTEELSRNRHGLYSPNTTYIQRGPNKLGEYVKYTHNPETGQEGDWIWLGQVGWVNTRNDPATQKCQPVGSPQFDGTAVTQEEYDACTARKNAAINEKNNGGGSSSSNDNNSGSSDTTSSDTTSSDTTAGEVTTEDTTSDDTTSITTSSGMMGSGSLGSLGGSYSAGVQALPSMNVAPPAPIQSSPRVDYVKALNSALAVDVMGGMMTGKRRL